MIEWAIERSAPSGSISTPRVIVLIWPESAAAVFSYEEKRITLAHVLATDLLGERAGVAVSIMMVTTFISEDIRHYPGSQRG